MAARARIAFLCTLAAAGLACGDFSGGSSGQTSAPQILGGTASTAGINAFASTVHPILREYCADCHEGAGPGSPHIAHASAPTAYQNVMGQGKVDLANPQSSRLVQKVGGGHECWVPATPVAGQTDCETDALILRDAIAQWSDIIDFGEGGVSIEETLASSTLSLADGVQDVGSERYSEGILALYEFKEGEGTIAADTSGHPDPINLVLSGDYVWMSGWGVQFNNGKAVSAVNYNKFYDEVASPETGSGQYSVELWATPADTVQDETARIITYSRNAGERNMTLGQNGYNYVFRNRALLEGVSNNGTPALETYDADQDLQDVLQHVVITYDQYRGRRIYVDGDWTDDVDEQGPGRLWNWGRNGGYRLGLGDEVSNDDRHWMGQIRLVAIYNQALSATQIQQNFAAGVGKRLLLRFDVSQWTEPGSSIEFVVTELDNYSYTFCEPTYRTITPSEFRLSNIRIAVNGVIATTGQAFRRVDTQVSGTQQLLSRVCSVIPKGDPATDTFTLVFEHLNGLQNLVDEGPPGELTIVMDGAGLPERGLRDFARANETMAKVTGVDPLDGPQTTYLDLRQQLPTNHDMRSFVSSQQIGIAKLSLEYCSEMVDADVPRLDSDPNKFFVDFPFDETPETAFDTTAERNLVFDPLYDRMLGDGLAEQPSRDEVRLELNTLVDTLMTACPCDVNHTRTMVKGICSAVLSSAAVSIH